MYDNKTKNLVLPWSTLEQLIEMLNNMDGHIKEVLLEFFVKKLERHEQYYSMPGHNQSLPERSETFVFYQQSYFVLSYSVIIGHKK